MGILALSGQTLKRNCSIHQTAGGFPFSRKGLRTGPSKRPFNRFRQPPDNYWPPQKGPKKGMESRDSPSLRLTGVYARATARSGLGPFHPPGRRLRLPPVPGQRSLQLGEGNGQHTVDVARLGIIGVQGVGQAQGAVEGPDPAFPAPGNCAPVPRRSHREWSKHPYR